MRDLVDRLQSLGFPPPCYPNYGAPDFCPDRFCFLLNMLAFPGHTTQRETLASLGSHQANVPIIPMRKCTNSFAQSRASRCIKLLARILCDLKLLNFRIAHATSR